MIRIIKIMLVLQILLIINQLTIVAILEKVFKLQTKIVLIIMLKLKEKFNNKIKTTLVRVLLIIITKLYLKIAN
jgi:hypothetical protein